MEVESGVPETIQRCFETSVSQSLAMCVVPVRISWHSSRTMRWKARRRRGDPCERRTS